MSRADGVHSNTCSHIAVPCDRPYCQDCTCDEEPLADWERDLLNEASEVATLTAQRDAARNIAARLEGELARLTERSSRESIRDVLRANLFDGSDEGLTTMPAKVFLDDASEVIADWLAADPDAVIAEGES